MSISLIRNNYFAKFVPVNFLIQGNVTLGLMSAVCRKRNSKSLDFPLNDYLPRSLPSIWNRRSTLTAKSKHQV